MPDPQQTTIITPDWVKDAVFYQIFPDRFARSNRVKTNLPLQDWDAPPTYHGFKGGDLFGVVEHLDYLSELGINAIYLNPIFASASNHRYHTYDYTNVDPLLGGNEALRELIDAAHARQIRIVLDAVFNHASRGFWQFHHVLENGAESPYVDWFHFNDDHLNGDKHFAAYPGPEAQQALTSGKGSYEAIGYSAWWDLPALPKFNTQTPAVREFLWHIATHWIEFGVDGWRFDVPTEIDDETFWQELRRRVKNINPDAYLVGEIWHDAPEWLSGDRFDAVMNYGMTIASLSFFGGDRLNLDETRRVGEYHRVRTIDAREFAAAIDHNQNLYDAAITFAQLNLLDSHDTPRFLTSVNGDQSALRLAMFFMFTYPGAPCIYYGDEIGMDGKHDPDCRKAFPWEQSSWSHDLLRFTKKCIALRHAHAVLRRGSYHCLYAKDDIYIFARQLDGATMLLALNIAQSERLIDVPLDTIGLSNGSMTDVWGTATWPLKDGIICNLRLAARSGMALIAV